MNGSKEEAIAETVDKVYRLQTFLLGRKMPAVGPGTMGYAFGMFDCGLQLNRLELNTKSAQMALRQMLSRLFEVDASLCLERLMIYQQNADFQNAQNVGGQDYHRWVTSDSPAPPTGLPHVVDPTNFPRGSA